MFIISTLLALSAKNINIKTREFPRIKPKYNAKSLNTRRELSVTKDKTVKSDETVISESFRNINYKLDIVTGELIISGTGEMSYNSNKYFPLQLFYADKIKSIIIENGVTSISDEVFSGLPFLETVTIADSLIS